MGSTAIAWNVDERLVEPLSSLQVGVCVGSLSVCDGVNGWLMLILQV